MLSPSQRLSYITLICKDISKSENLTFSTDQTCSVPGRSIVDNCHLLRNILDYIEQKDSSGIYLCIDNEKAFDRVSHKHLFRLLKAFNFGPNLTKWIQLLYFEARGSVIVCFISEPFSLSRGVHQGRALSPLLYVLSLEPLLNKIRADPKIEGIKVPGSKIEVKISAFADDITCALSSRLSVAHVLNVCKLFEAASGSKLNLLKTNGLWLGRWADCPDKPYGIYWTSDPMRIVGIRFASRSPKLLYDVNWGSLYDKVVSTFNLWKGRHLSFKGGLSLINIIGLSKLWYVGSSAYLSDKWLNLLEHAQYLFLERESRMFEKGYLV